MKLQLALRPAGNRCSLSPLCGCNSARRARERERERQCFYNSLQLNAKVSFCSGGAMPAKRGRAKRKKEGRMEAGKGRRAKKCLEMREGKSERAREGGGRRETAGMGQTHRARRNLIWKRKVPNSRKKSTRRASTGGQGGEGGREAERLGRFFTRG